MSSWVNLRPYKPSVVNRFYDTVKQEWNLCNIFMLCINRKKSLKLILFSDEQWFHHLSRYIKSQNSKFTKLMYKLPLHEIMDGV
jgi:hypothetical protein